MKRLLIKKQNTWFFLYYVLLLVVFLTWNDAVILPPLLLRIGYFCALLVPVFFWRQSWLPAVIILFFSLLKNSYSSSYLPTGIYNYFVAIIIGLLFMKKDRSRRVKIPISLIIMVVYATMVNMVKSTSIESVSLIGLMTILLIISLDKSDINQLSIIELSIIAISLTLTLSYFLYGAESRTISYADADLERVGFADANYVGCLIGFGVLLTVIKLLDNNRMSVIGELFCFGIVVSSVIALFGNASRGSLLALGVGVAVFVLFSSASFRKRLLFIILMIGFLFFLYNNSYMDMLFYRIENDVTSGGSGRLEIWRAKLDLYLHSDITTLLFGYGYQPGRDLAGRDAFHNDFLAMLVEYGLVGFISFLVFFFLPIFKIKKDNNNKGVVLGCFVYLLIVCFTLEPFAAGRLPFYAFWLYIYCLSLLNNSNLRPYLGGAD